MSSELFSTLYIIQHEVRAWSKLNYWLVVVTILPCPLFMIKNLSNIFLIKSLSGLCGCGLHGNRSDCRLLTVIKYCNTLTMT